MGKIYDAFDKYCILDIIIGFIFGIYLAVNHNDAHIWLIATQFVLIFSFVVSLVPIGVAIHSKYKYSEKIPVKALLEAFALNVAMTAVCAAFGVVIGSFVIGNYIADNGLLFH